MGYTDVHFAAKDTFSLFSFLATILVWGAFGVFLVALAIPLILVGGIVLLVRYVRRRKAAAAQPQPVVTGGRDLSPRGVSRRRCYITFRYSGGRTYLTGGHDHVL